MVVVVLVVGAVVVGDVVCVLVQGGCTRCNTCLSPNPELFVHLDESYEVVS